MPFKDPERRREYDRNWYKAHLENRRDHNARRIRVGVIGAQLYIGRVPTLEAFTKRIKEAENGKE